MIHHVFFCFSGIPKCKSSKPCAGHGFGSPVYFLLKQASDLFRKIRRNLAKPSGKRLQVAIENGPKSQLVYQTVQDGDFPFRNLCRDLSSPKVPLKAPWVHPKFQVDQDAEAEALGEQQREALPQRLWRLRHRPRSLETLEIHQSSESTNIHHGIHSLENREGGRYGKMRCRMLVQCHLHQPPFITIFMAGIGFQPSKIRVVDMTLLYQHYKKMSSNIPGLQNLSWAPELEVQAHQDMVLDHQTSLVAQTRGPNAQRPASS